MNQPNHSRIRSTLYPMAGTVTEQLSNLLCVLDWVQKNAPAPEYVRAWIEKSFGTGHRFAENIYTVLLSSGGLTEIHGGKCCLTRSGRDVLHGDSCNTLLRVFEERFVGIATILEVLKTQDPLRTSNLEQRWYGIVSSRYPATAAWRERTRGTQFRHRLNWLRAMGLLNSTDEGYSLSESGRIFVQELPPESLGIQQDEVNEQEAEIRQRIQERFELFEATTVETTSLRKVYVRREAFRSVVRDQYDYHCAICGLRLNTPRDTYETEAAHIVPKSYRGTDDPRNGINLCRTCHWSFDEGLVTIDPKTLLVDTTSCLEDLDSNSSQRLLNYRGKLTRPVRDPQYTPSRDALTWHQDMVFLG